MTHQPAPSNRTPNPQVPIPAGHVPLSRPSIKQQSTREEAAKFLQAELSRLEATNKGLQADKIALVQEFIKADDNEAPEIVRKNLKRLTVPALDVLEELMMTAKSEGVRAGIAKYIIDRGLMPSILGGDPAAKELAKMIEELSPTN
jgi:hypothetical protein